MVSTRSMMVVLIGAAIAATLFVPISDAVTNNTGTVSVTNETVTADVGNPVQLEGYNLDNSTVVVYEYNDTRGAYDQATAGADYDIGVQNGSITVLGTSDDIQGGEDVKVTYDYQATDSTTETVAGLIPLLTALLILVVIANKVMEAM